MNEALQAILEANRRGFRITFPSSNDPEAVRFYVEIEKTIFQSSVNRLLAVDSDEGGLETFGNRLSGRMELIDEEVKGRLRFALETLRKGSLK